MSVPWSCTCACFNHVGFLSGSALSLVCILYLSYCQSVYLWLALLNCGYPFHTNFFLYLMTTVSRLCADKPHASTCFPNTPTCHRRAPMCPASPHQFISCWRTHLSTPFNTRLHTDKPEDSCPCNEASGIPSWHGNPVSELEQGRWENGGGWDC